MYRDRSLCASQHWMLFFFCLIFLFKNQTRQSTCTFQKVNNCAQLLAARHQVSLIMHRENSTSTGRTDIAFCVCTAPTIMKPWGHKWVSFTLWYLNQHRNKVYDLTSTLFCHKFILWKNLKITHIGTTCPVTKIEFCRGSRYTHLIPKLQRERSRCS